MIRSVVAQTQEGYAPSAMISLYSTILASQTFVMLQSCETSVERNILLSRYVDSFLKIKAIDFSL
jgi:hypothetical protein